MYPAPATATVEIVVIMGLLLLERLAVPLRCCTEAVGGMRW
jgi:hypothetical protein